MKVESIFGRLGKMETCVCCGKTLGTESGKHYCNDCEEFLSPEITINKMLLRFGEDSQIDVAIEEMSELIKELIKYKRSKIHFREKQATSRQNVVEEISDVLFMFEYLKMIFGISEEEIDRMILAKAKRTEARYLSNADRD